MAAYNTSNVYPNLVDWTRMVDPHGLIADMAWLLAQCNDILKDMIFQEANAPLGHKVSVNSGLPQGTWRGNNQGVASTKALFSQYEFGIGVLSDYSKVDKVEADLNGQTERFRWTQDNAHIEGMSQQVASAMFYSNEQVNQNQFTGFSPYYSQLLQSNAQTAKNVISGGGSASANASLWLIGWGDSTVFSIFPKGSKVGLDYQNKGDLRELYDSNGNGFEGYTSYFEWKIGLAIPNWQYNVRICNLDTTTAGLLGTSPADLNVLMSQAVNKLPTLNRRVSGITEVDAPGDPMPGITPAWYCNRTVRTALDTQAIRDKNVLISFKDYAGAPVTEWRGVPIRVVDALTNAEATLT